MKYILDDWSLNPFVVEDISLRQLIVDCTALKDEDIVTISNLDIGKCWAGSEFCITRTA